MHSYIFMLSMKPSCHLFMYFLVMMLSKQGTLQLKNVRAAPWWTTAGEKNLMQPGNEHFSTGC